MLQLQQVCSKIICSEHKTLNYSIQAICVDLKCKKQKKILCFKCLDLHQGHTILYMDKVQELIITEYTKYKTEKIQTVHNSFCLIEESIKLFKEKLLTIFSKIKQVQKNLKLETDLEVLYNTYIKKNIKTEKEIHQMYILLMNLLTKQNYIFKLEQSNQFKDLEYIAKSFALETCFFTKQTQHIKHSQIFKQSQSIKNLENYLNENQNQINKIANTNFEEVPTEISSLQNIKINQISVDCQTDPQIINNDQYIINQQFSFKCDQQIGIFVNVKISTLYNRGFQLIYEKPFSIPFTSQMIERLKNDFTTNQLICIGGRKKNNPQNIIQLCAIDKIDEIYIPSTKALQTHKSKSGEIYWYYFESKCFGFSKISNISASQYTVDNLEEQGQFRFSIWLDGDCGYRVGNDKNIKDEYYLVIYKQF